MVALVCTDPGQRREGLPQLLIEIPNPGVLIRQIITIDGARHLNEVVFEDACVDGSALLGKRGEGWAQVTAELAMNRSDPERIQSTFPVLAEWAATIRENDAPAQFKLGRLVARLAVLRRMSFVVAQEPPAREAALVKDLGTRFEGDLVEAVRRFADVPPGHPSALGTFMADGILHGPAFTPRGGTSEDDWATRPRKPQLQ